MRFSIDFSIDYAPYGSHCQGLFCVFFFTLQKIKPVCFVRDLKLWFQWFNSQLEHKYLITQAWFIPPPTICCAPLVRSYQFCISKSEVATWPVPVGGPEFSMEAGWQLLIDGNTVDRFWFTKDGWIVTSGTPVQFIRTKNIQVCWTCVVFVKLTLILCNKYSFTNYFQRIFFIKRFLLWLISCILSENVYPKPQKCIIGNKPSKRVIGLQMICMNHAVFFCFVLFFTDRCDESVWSGWHTFRASGCRLSMCLRTQMSLQDFTALKRCRVDLDYITDQCFQSRKRLCLKCTFYLILKWIMRSEDCTESHKNEKI